MIDPLDSLALSIQASPGVYSLLLGSGVSRAASIPTGWEITLDLVRKLAAASDQSAEPDLERWYQDNYQEPLDYSRLLDRLAMAQAERQQLLRPYVEPTEQQRNDGLKQPTSAHRSIAEMVARGFIRVIVTTNFERLMETALNDVGVQPLVVSTPDHVEGMPPLVHIDCLVLKRHGDYRDTRILNTPAELENYAERIRGLLDRIFDEFGLVACGWSSVGDVALRNAIYRSRSRPFTTFWTTHGELGDEATKLTDFRSAARIQISDADSFFQTLSERVQSIEEFSKPHPLSVAIGVSSLKRYLPEPRYGIRLTDLIEDTVGGVVQKIASIHADLWNPTPSRATISDRFRHYEALSEMLLHMAGVGARWSEVDGYEVWRRSLSLLLTVPPVIGNPVWLGLRRYQATPLFYALGIGAVMSGRLQFLRYIFETPTKNRHGEDSIAVQVVPALRLLDGMGVNQFGTYLEGMERIRAPLSNWIFAALREASKRVIPEDDEYVLVFDRLEARMALGYAYHRVLHGYWAPAGAFAYRRHDQPRVLAHFKDSMSELGSDSPYVKSGRFGDSQQECSEALAKLEELVEPLSRA